jgi:hypothetical protein
MEVESLVAREPPPVGNLGPHSHFLAGSLPNGFRALLFAVKPGVTIALF